MGLDRRVTLRCLVDDLTAGWSNADHYRCVKQLRTVIGKRLANEAQDAEVAKYLKAIPRVNALEHPLVQQFNESFEAEEDRISRESISGLTGPHWWKQKTMQWRGAATDHAMVGNNEVWLCAAGIRRKGDSDDFYKAFMRDVKRAGSGPWLPAAEDRLLVKIDEKVSALDAWKMQIHCCTLALLLEAERHPGETVTVRFPAPSRGVDTPAVGEISLSVDSVDVDGTRLTEAFLAAKILDRSKVTAVDVAVQIARAALKSNAEEWHSTTYKENSFAFSAFIDPSAREHARELEQSGTLSSDSTPGSLRLGVRAHYAREDGLVDAQVEGSSVRALCGYWFVPTADHVGLETCNECTKQYGQLPKL